NPQVTAAPPPPPRRRPAPPPPQEAFREAIQEGVDEEPLPDEEEPVRKKGGMKTRSRMRLANIGLGFHYAKILCGLVAIAISLFMYALLPILASARSEGMLRVVQILSCISLVLIAVTPLLGGTGSLLCFWVPSKSRSKVMVIVSFSLEVAFIALVLISIITAMGAAAGGMRGGPEAAMGFLGAGFVM